MQTALHAIRAKGFLPGMWLAPFIAQPDSKVLKEHPDWFVKNAEGLPLDSSKIGFGGWAPGPGAVLDGTNPDTQKHLEDVFHTMRETWGVTYFKLDANYWGAIHGGRHSDPKATRVEAYRRGLEAILRGAGPDAVILGCNAPIWPSLGLVNAMRTSNDVSRSWAAALPTPREKTSTGVGKTGGYGFAIPTACCSPARRKFRRTPGVSMPLPSMRSADWFYPETRSGTCLSAARHPAQADPADGKIGAV